MSAHDHVLTLGIEEEFQIIDPETRELGFRRLRIDARLTFGRCSGERMKVTNIALLALVAAFLGCSRNIAPPKTVEITGDDFMKFNLTSFEAKPGQSVTVRLKNIGELPKEAVAHNWVLLAKDAYAPKFIEAGFSHPETDYIATHQSVYVLAKTRMLGPGESDSVTFTAPRDPGAYDYICTFPDHYAGGMKGVMTVRP